MRKKKRRLIEDAATEMRVDDKVHSTVELGRRGGLELRVPVLRNATEDGDDPLSARTCNHRIASTPDADAMTIRS